MDIGERVVCIQTSYNNLRFDKTIFKITLNNVYTVISKNNILSNKYGMLDMEKCIKILNDNSIESYYPIIFFKPLNIVREEVIKEICK